MYKFFILESFYTFIQNNIDMESNRENNKEYSFQDRVDFEESLIGEPTETSMSREEAIKRLEDLKKKDKVDSILNNLIQEGNDK